MNSLLNALFNKPRPLHPLAQEEIEGRDNIEENEGCARQGLISTLASLALLSQGHALEQQHSLGALEISHQWKTQRRVAQAKLFEGLRISVENQETAQRTQLVAQEMLGFSEIQPRNLIETEEASLRRAMESEKQTALATHHNELSSTVALCQAHQAALRLIRQAALPATTISFDEASQTHSLHNVRVQALLDSCEELLKHAAAIAPLADLSPKQFQERLSMLVSQVRDSLETHKNTRKKAHGWVLSKIGNKVKEKTTSSATREHITPLITQANKLLVKLNPPDISKGWEKIDSDGEAVPVKIEWDTVV